MLPSRTIGDTWLSTLRLGLAQNISENPGMSGVELLSDGLDAFTIRKILLENAERSVDLQYYIWHDDLTGNLMLEQVRAAAARGVRIRLLLDDNGIAGLDPILRLTAGSPNIEIKLFNPFHSRRFKALNFLFRFRRANRRMHSKSFIADNQVAIVGGRNIGDEYFAAKRLGVFADLDAACIGPVVQEVTDCFDRFWDSPLAVQIEEIVPEVSPSNAVELESRLTRRVGDRASINYRQDVADAPLLRRLAQGEAELTWAPVKLVSDPPEKVSSNLEKVDSLLDELTDIIGEPQTELLIVSAYFVPTNDGARAFGEMARSGVDLRVLTNSYASTDVGVVHAGYAKHRRKLIEAGVKLFEVPAPNDEPKKARKFIWTDSRKRNGQPGTTLHAKAFSVDAKRLFVGSLNFDPRSFNLNTELGIVIDSPRLAEQMRTVFDTAIEQNTYHVVIDDGRLGWIDARDDNPMIEQQEPGTSLVSRALVRLLEKLPIDPLL
ncbi:putative ymdC hydrolase, of the phospholipase family [Aurantiacibacter atlanticus]|uniref:Phospholipase D n=2 Tax=Aurantiacibacter atlanticus TaxID=1648404 RepID=A0A0H4VFJ4_9SPHN|nr:putative ymdC hydrolase, of the phospholipase family [Aurantiacibacter atlanticus]